MSAPHVGKRPLSDIAREAEANVRASKRRAHPRRAASPPSLSPLPSYKPGETVYRILCPASKTGSVIGKGGSIIKSIREDTGAAIRVEDAVFGCDERVVTISAKEEDFHPQKFRGPGNYRKSEGEDKEDYMSDSDDEQEQSAGALGQPSEEKKEEAAGSADAKLDKETLVEPESEKEKLTEAHIDKEKAVETEKENLAVETEKENLAVEEKSADAAEQESTETVAARLEQVEEKSNEAIAEVSEGGKENGKKEVSHPPAESGTEPREKKLSPVQEALLRVHLRILEADPTKPEENHVSESGKDIVTRLLVPTSQVGCLLGKQGKIVSQMREETGAQIRVLPKDQLPTCALRADEVVQIAGDLTAVRKALLAVSTQLRNNPPKRPGEDSKAVPPAKDFSRKGGGARVKKVLGRSPPRHSLGQSSAVSLPFGKGEVTFRIMCPKEKIGSIIGKGGTIVQSIREETGAKISIDVSSDVGEERVIHVSAHELPEDVFSKAQRAVMILHSRILAVDQDKDGLVTTKLLVPADQAGCLLGKGGSIVIEMRKLTRAKIHIYGREHLPPCALKTDELVEVVGNFNASQEALMQITTRLRNNLFPGMTGLGFKDPKLPPFSGLASANEGPLSLRSQMMPAAASYERDRAPYPDILSSLPATHSHGAWSSQPAQSYAQDTRSNTLPDYLGLGHTRELAAQPKSRPSAAYITSQTVEVIVPEHTINSILGENGSNLHQICKISGARVKVNGVTPGALETVVEISGTPDQTHAAQSLLQAFILSGQ